MGPPTSPATPSCPQPLLGTGDGRFATDDLIDRPGSLFRLGLIHEPQMEVEGLDLDGPAHRPDRVLRRSA